MKRDLSTAFLFAAVFFVMTSSVVSSNNAYAATGDVGADPIIDTFEFDATATDPNIIHVSGDVYAVAYEGAGADGFVKTVTVDADGVITGTIDTFEYDTSDGMTPNIIHVSGDYYAIVYEDAGEDGTIVTITITAAGDIGAAVIDSLVFDATRGKTPNIIHVSGDYYAIAYHGPSDDGFVKTLTISTVGVIPAAVTDTLEYDAFDGRTPNIIHVSGDYYAIAYSGVDADGFVKTLTISTVGDLPAAVTDTLEYDTSDGKTPNIIHVSGDYYAIVYGDAGDVGTIKTLTITAAGDLPAAVTDTLVFDADKAKDPNIILVSDDVYAIAYSGAEDDGFVKTLTISSVGDLPGAVTDTGVFDAVKGVTPNIINVAGSVYAVVYQGSSGDVITITIDDSGDIPDGTIEDVVFDATATDPNIIHVSGDVYAVAYGGVDADGFVKTVMIDEDGVIGAVIDTFEYDTSDGMTPNIIHVSGDYYAIVYEDAGEDGTIKTITITAAGDIGAAVIDTLVFDGGKAKTPNIIHVSGDYYAIAYEDKDNVDGTIKTLTITTAGDLPAAVTDTLAFDTVKGLAPNIIHVSGDYYAIAYSGAGDDGFVKTLTISTVGDLPAAVTDTLEYDTSDGKTPNIIHVSGDYYAIVYGDAGDVGTIVTLTISSVGDLPGAVTDTLVFDADKAKDPNIILVSGDVYAIAYSGGLGAGDDDDGWVKTVMIDEDDGVISLVDGGVFNAGKGVTPNLINVAGSVYAIVFEGGSGHVTTLEIETEAAPVEEEARVKGHGGCRGDCTAPTIGVDASGARQVSGGIQIDDNPPMDAEFFYTHIDLITLNVGETHKMTFRVYESGGPANLASAQLCISIPFDQQITDTIPCIMWTQAFDGTQTVSTRGSDVFMNGYTAEGHADGVDEIVTYTFAVNSPQDPSKFGLRIADGSGNSMDTYFNDGLQVVGESLVPLKYLVATDEFGNLYQLYPLPTDVTVAVDQNGKVWKLGPDFNWYTIKNGMPSDVSSSDMPQVFERNHPWFGDYKQGQADTALEKAKSMYGNNLYKSFTKQDDIKTFMNSYKDRWADGKLKEKMLAEEVKAQHTSERL